MRVRNEYDLLGRLTKVFQNKRLILENIYSNKSLLLEEIIYGNRVREQFTYDHENRLIKRTTVAKDQSLISEQAYEWNEQNEIVANKRIYF